MITINYQRSDISKSLITNAYRGTSFSPEKRGQHIVNDYVTHFTELETQFSGYATADNQVDIEADLERYRQGYVSRLTAYLHSHSNVMSAFITGPANFPTARNQKRSQWADNKMAEFINYQKKVLPKLRRKYDPRLIASAPVSLADEDAVTKLQAKIGAAQSDQTFMKVANKIIRKKNLTDDQKVEQLIPLGVSEFTARKLLQPDYMDRTGFASYQLTNNNANIRRMKDRIKRLKREQDKPAKTEEVNGVKVVENKDITRLQLIFPGKPAANIRTNLKSHGFRWSRRYGAWQRLLNDNARYAAQQVLKSI